MQPLKLPTDREPGILNGQPTNTNPSFASNYRLMIPKVRNAVYFCSEVTFPEWTCEAVKMSHPFAGSMKFWGNKCNHGDMTMKFLVNEDYSNYRSLEDWFKKTLVYEDFFKTGIDTSPNLLSNTAQLLILSNKKNPVAKFRINGLFITNLTSIDYNSALTDASATTATATFSFSTFDLEPIVDG